MSKLKFENFTYKRGEKRLIALNTLLETTVKEKASDLHLTVGVPPTIRVNGQLTHIGGEKLTPLDTDRKSVV